MNNIASLFEETMMGLEELFPSRSSDATKQVTSIVTKCIVDQKNIPVSSIMKIYSSSVPTMPSNRRGAPSPRSTKIGLNNPAEELQTKDECVVLRRQGSMNIEVAATNPSEEIKMEVKDRCMAIKAFVELGKVDMDKLVDLCRGFSRIADDCGYIETNAFCSKTIQILEKSARKFEFVEPTLHHWNSEGSFETDSSDSFHSFGFEEIRASIQHIIELYEDAAGILLKLENPMDNMKGTRKTSLNLTRDLMSTDWKGVHDDLTLVNYKPLVYQISKYVPGLTKERIRIFFDMFGHPETGLIPTAQLSSILYKTESTIGRFINEAEQFMLRLDEDGDGTITSEEFQIAVEREPFILESIISQHSSKYSFEDLHHIRAFARRSCMTWAQINYLWSRLQSRSRQERRQSQNIREAVDVAIPIDQFEGEVYSVLHPPDPLDRMIIRGLTSQFKHESEFGYIAAREFILALAGALGLLQIGISDVRYKAEFYFSLYNIDDEDRELSRDEIYYMLYASHGETGKQIIEANSLLSAIDIDRDGMVALEEYLKAAELEPKLYTYFEMN